MKGLCNISGSSEKIFKSAYMYTANTTKTIEFECNADETCTYEYICQGGNDGRNYLSIKISASNDKSTWTELHSISMYKNTMTHYKNASTGYKFYKATLSTPNQTVLIYFSITNAKEV